MPRLPGAAVVSSGNGKHVGPPLIPMRVDLPRSDNPPRVISNMLLHDHGLLAHIGKRYASTNFEIFFIRNTPQVDTPEGFLTACC